MTTETPWVEWKKYLHKDVSGLWYIAAPGRLIAQRLLEADADAIIAAHNLARHEPRCELCSAPENKAIGYHNRLGKWVCLEHSNGDTLTMSKRYTTETEGE